MNSKTGQLLLLLILTLSLVSCAMTSGEADIPSLPRNPQAAENNVRLGVIYMQQGKMPLASTKFKRALAQDPNSSLVYWTNAVFEEKLGEVKTAEKYFRKAVQLNKNDSEAHNNFGAFLCRQGRVDEALEEFELAVKNPLYQTPEFAYTNAGVCLVQQNDSARAREYFHKALEINSNNATALYQMALLNYGEGRYVRAQDFLQRLSGQARNNPKVLWLCAATERQLGNFAEANRCKLQLRKNFPLSREADRLP